jgi:hypothetical protein
MSHSKPSNKTKPTRAEGGGAAPDIATSGKPLLSLVNVRSIRPIPLSESDGQPPQSTPSQLEQSGSAR